MKKRILSIVLILCMTLCLVPTTVFAEQNKNYVKINTSELGYVHASPTYANAGETINIQVIPNAGYMPKEVIVITEDGAECVAVTLVDGANYAYIFTMPDSNVIVDAIFGFSVPEGWYNDPDTRYWYYYRNGEMQTGWCSDIPGWDGKWFYFDPNTGVMRTGWCSGIPGWDGKWFYFDPNTGVMQTGWVEDNGNWYYFGDDGAMLTNTVTPDGKTVDQDGKLVTSEGETGVAINKTNFPDTNLCTLVNNWFDKDGDGYLSNSEIDAVTYFDCSGKYISDLTGIEYFTKLQTLFCSYNQLTSLDVSKNIELKVLRCNNNQLTSLDVSRNTALTTLYCDKNQLTSLDTSSNTALERLDCYNNQLTSLNVSKNIALKALSCINNQLTSLDISRNTALTILYCENNRLTSLDTSSNTALETLDCYNNQLTSLDVSKNMKLTSLDCSNNTYHIVVDENNSFDLSALPGGFDVGKASNWNGGTVNGNTLTVDNDKDTVTYTYDCGNGKTAEFKLTIAYTVAFNTDGGSAVEPQTVAYGKTATQPDTPTKTGYTFAGWYLGKEKFEFDTAVTKSITLYAKWTAKQYTITIKPENGEKDIVITQDFGTPITAPKPEKTGYTFAGWDKTIPATMPAENMTVTAQWTINQYTITIKPENGEKDIIITQDYGTAITTPADPTKTGYTFVGWDKTIPATMPAENMTIKAKWQDVEKPTGEIKINENKWNSFLNKITFGLFFKETQTVTITAEDNSGETVTIEYHLSNKELTEAELANATFTEYTDSFSINPDNEYIIYVKLTDKSDNVTYISSTGIVLDGTTPDIRGIENGKTYCKAQTVTIIEKYVDTVTVNTIPVTLDKNQQFVLSPADGEQEIVVTDKAGNVSKMTVTVNDGHTSESDDGDCTTPVLCAVCNETVIPAKEHNFSTKWEHDEKDHYHTCQNENCNVKGDLTKHSGTDDGDCTTAVVCECGYELTPARANHDFTEWKSNKNGTHTRSCKTNGCEKQETDNCSGGTATCTHKSVCEICNNEYGELDHDNHTGEKEWTKTETTHEQKYTCCKAVVAGEESHEWKDGACLECGYICEHKGGTATCTHKAVCEICGDEYGEIDANNHINIKEFPAVAATAKSEGNKIYWQCLDCGKYFSDKQGKTEIKLSDTVISKLPPQLISGKDSQWTQGNTKGLKFKLNVISDDNINFLIDGKKIDNKNYNVYVNDDTLELKPEYLETLSLGSHSITIQLENGEVSTKFTINEKTTSPKTGNNANVLLPTAILLISLWLTAVYVYRKNRRKS